MSTVLGRSPASLPLTTGEGNAICNALLEVLDRLEALESQVRALASVLDAGEVVGGPPSQGEFTTYVRERMQAVRAGTFGEAGVSKFAERLAESRRQTFDPRNDPEGRLRQQTMVEARLMGAKIGGRGELYWSHTFDDPTGAKRTAEARQRAQAAIDREDKAGAR